VQAARDRDANEGQEQVSQHDGSMCESIVYGIGCGCH